MKNSDPYLKEAKIKNDILEFCQKKNNERGQISSTIVWVKKFERSKSMTQQFVRDYLRRVAFDGYLTRDEGDDFIFNVEANAFLKSGGYINKYEEELRKKDIIERLDSLSIKRLLFQTSPWSLAGWILAVVVSFAQAVRFVIWFIGQFSS